VAYVTGSIFIILGPLYISGMARGFKFGTHTDSRPTNQKMQN